ncbi:MAG: creatininase [Acidiferrobacteraceae bacterium]|nr:creatininase [Acidiferrobacteraceae bacterium]
MEMPRTVEINNGVPSVPTFSEQEMDHRVKRLRQWMEREEIDACLFTSIHNINYFSDFVYCSFGRNYGLVVTQEKLTTLSANIDGGQPKRETFGNDNLVYTDWQRGNFFYALSMLIKDQRRIGVEFDHLTLQVMDAIKESLSGCEFVDIAPGTMKMRMIKSPEEHALIRDGARVCDLGGSALVEAVSEGVPEYEVALHSTQTMVRAIAHLYPDVELMDTWTWFQSGINTDGAHNPVTTRKVEKGDILSLNCFAMISGYYQALERTLFFDHASDAHLQLWEINCEVHRRGLELIKPGARCMDIALELNQIYLRHDLLEYRTFGYGHSFGTLSHYYGREAGLELREDIETVLKPGMVISMEPMIMIPEGMAGSGGYREHDILIITEEGAENITSFPFGPDYNVIKSTPLN